MAHVLVIDGDPAFAQLVADFAAGLGHTSRHAPTLAEGLLAATEADVIYLAASLPDGCGLEALAGLRALPSAPEVIVTGAAGNPDTAEKAIRGGCMGMALQARPRGQGGAAATARTGLPGQTPRQTRALHPQARHRGVQPRAATVPRRCGRSRGQ